MLWVGDSIKITDTWEKLIVGYRTDAPPILDDMPRLFMLIALGYSIVYILSLFYGSGIPKGSLTIEKNTLLGTKLRPRPFLDDMPRLLMRLGWWSSFWLHKSGEGGRFYFIFFNVYDHKTLCRILHVFLTRSMQTSSSVVAETTPWPSIMIVATMNGISDRNFTMNATKFHITMPWKLASAALHSVALRVMQHFNCASLPCYSKALLTAILQFPQRSHMPVLRVEMPAKLKSLLYWRMFLNIERNFNVFFK